MMVACESNHQSNGGHAGHYYSILSLYVFLYLSCSVCLFVCYSCGTPESPLPLNPGQGSDSPCKIAATRSISVRGQRSHVPYPRWPAEYVRHVQSRGSVVPMILPPRAWGNWCREEEPDLPSSNATCGLLALGKAKHISLDKVCQRG